MTSPIALLLPIAVSEPASQPAPAEDPALFAAALVAALQSVMVQAPGTPAPTPDAPNAQQSTSKEEAQAQNADGTEAVPDSTGAASDAGEAAPVLSRSPRSSASRLNAADAVKAAGTPVVTQGRRLSVRNLPTRTDAPAAKAPTPALIGEGGLTQTEPEATGRIQVQPPVSGAQPQRQRRPSTEVSAESVTPPPSETTPATSAREISGSASAPTPSIISTAGQPVFRPEGRTTASGEMIWTTAPVSGDGRQAEASAPSTVIQHAVVITAAVMTAPSNDPRTNTVPRATVVATGDTDLYPSELSGAADGTPPVSPESGTKRVRVSNSWEHPSVDVPTGSARVASPSAEPIVVGDRNETPGDSTSPLEARSPRRKADSRVARMEPTPTREPTPQAVTPPALLVMSMVADTPAVPPAAEQAPESGEPGTTAPAVAASESSTAPAALSGDATVAAEVPASDSNANRGLDFARELAALLGDAEITELKVTVGRRPRGAEQSSAAGPTAGEEHASLDATPATPRSEAAPVVPVASRRPMQAEVAASPAAMPGREINRAPDDDLLSNAGSDRTPLPSATVAGPRDPAVVMHPAPVGTTSRRAPSRMTEGGHTLHEKDSAEGETVRVRLAQAAPQRSAPRALPFDDTQADRRAVQSRASILPEARQELPPSPEHDGEAVIVPRTGEQIETRDPSDSPDRASIATQPPSAPTNRGDSRVREALNGEARNMPDRAETKDRPAGVADRVTLQVADADGRQTRIRVTVLGDQVRAVLVPSDQESARHLERRMDDLQAALVRQGFADPKVSVQSPLAASTAAPWGAAPAGTQAEHASGRGTDQPAEDRGQGSGRQEQDRRGDGQRQSQQRFRERDRDDRQNQDA